MPDGAGVRLRENDNPTGLVQGSTLSPLLVEINLHNTVDRAHHTGSTNTALLRYVDDLCILGRTPSEAQEGMEIVHQSVTRTGQHLKGKDTGTYDLRQNNPGRPTVLGVLPEWENDQLTLSQTDKAWQHLDDLLEECQLKANTTQSTTAVINGWINSSAPGFRKSTGQDVSQRILETLVKHNANRIGIRTISDQVSRATQQWETIVERTGMQFLNNNDRSGGTQG